MIIFIHRFTCNFIIFLFVCLFLFSSLDAEAAHVEISYVENSKLFDFGGKNTMTYEENRDDKNNCKKKFTVIFFIKIVFSASHTDFLPFFFLLSRLIKFRFVEFYHYFIITSWFKYISWSECYYRYLTRVSDETHFIWMPPYF